METSIQAHQSQNKTSKLPNGLAHAHKMLAGLLHLTQSGSTECWRRR